MNELRRSSGSRAFVCCPELVRLYSKTFPRSARSIRGWNRLQTLGTVLPIPHMVMLATASFLVQERNPRMGVLVVLLFETDARPSAARRLQSQHLLAPSALDQSPFWTVMLNAGELHEEDSRIRLQCCPRCSPPGLDCPAPTTNQAKKHCQQSGFGL